MERFVIMTNLNVEVKRENPISEHKMLIGMMSDSKWYNTAQLRTVCGNPQARMSEIRKRSHWDFAKSKIDGRTHYKLGTTKTTKVVL